ncbi:oxidoreductase [Francisellaceae bacterium]|nr:oxidoreductase [Francisellaceae bacterium]
MIKVGVIGFGLSATVFHIPFINASENMELIAISTSKKYEMLKAHPYNVAHHLTADELIKDQNVELVVITAPNEVHYSLAKQALEKGKHVVLEKPMTNTIEEAEKLINLANAKNLILSVFHNRRWDGDFLTIKKLIDSGKLGEVRTFESHFDRFRPEVRERWREVPGPGAGILYDLGSHLIDQALCLFGTPQSLTARCLPLRDKSQIADYFHIQLHYDKLEVILHASMLSAGENRRFRVDGTKGTYIKYGLDPQENQLRNGMSPSDSGYGIESKNDYGMLCSELQNDVVKSEVGNYAIFYQGVTDAIQGKKTTHVTAESALEVIKLIELSEKSSQSCQTVTV